MNTFQMQCFLAVAETLSFARAAKKMNITQPSVTYQIKSLETELNVRLFRRTTRSVEITDAGKMLINDAQNMLLLAGRIRRRYETPQINDSALFSIGCHDFNHLLALPEVLQKMEAKYPAFYPDLQIVPFEHLYRMLEEESVDVILAFKENDSKKTPGHYTELTTVPIVAICRADYSVTSNSDSVEDDFNVKRVILNNPNKCPPALSEIQAHCLERCKPEQLYYCDSPEVAITLVKAGFGITFLPKILIPKDSAIAELSTGESASLSYGVYYRTLKNNPMLKDFINYAKKVYL